MNTTFPSGLPPDPDGRQFRYVRNPNAEELRRLPAPTAVALSKRDLYDEKGTIAAMLSEEHLFADEHCPHLLDLGRTRASRSSECLPANQNAQMPTLISSSFPCGMVKQQGTLNPFSAFVGASSVRLLSAIELIMVDDGSTDQTLLVRKPPRRPSVIGPS